MLAKKIRDFLFINKLDLTFIIIVVFISLFTWQGILNQSISGEGFYYFTPELSFITPDGKLTNILHNHDNFAKLLTYLLESFFGGQMQPYMSVQLLIITLLNICIYLAVKSITGKSWLAFIAALYFGTNYTGNFQIFARGHFHWFTQRVPEFFPILASMVFIYKFVQSQKKRYYALALSFFTLAFFTTHYTSIFLPFFPGFFLISGLLKTKNRISQVIQFSLLGLPFVIINYLIVSNSTLSLSTIRPNQTLLQAILENKDVYGKISFELVVATIPLTILQLLREVTGYSFVKIIPLLIIPTYLFYFLIGFILYKKKVPYFNFIAACFIGLMGALFLSVFLGRINVYNEIEQGRYYFIPKLYVGIIIASFIYTVFLSNLKTKLQLIRGSLILFLIALYLATNIVSIWTKIRDSQRYYTGGRVMLKYLEKVKKDLPPNSIVMLPNPLMPSGTDFLRKYYSGQNTQFQFIDSNWKNKVPEDLDLNKLYVFDYNEEYNRGGSARIEFISVVDKSEEYRKSLKSTKD